MQFKLLNFSTSLLYRGTIKATGVLASSRQHQPCPQLAVFLLLGSSIWGHMGAVGLHVACIRADDGNGDVSIDSTEEERNEEEECRRRRKGGRRRKK